MPSTLAGCIVSVQQIAIDCMDRLFILWILRLCLICLKSQVLTKVPGNGRDSLDICWMKWMNKIWESCYLSQGVYNLPRDYLLAASFLSIEQEDPILPYLWVMLFGWASTPGSRYRENIDSRVGIWANFCQGGLGFGSEGARGNPGFPATECKLGAFVTNWLTRLRIEPT